MIAHTESLQRLAFIKPSIRELQPGDPEPAGSTMSLPHVRTFNSPNTSSSKNVKLQVDGDDTPVILATVEQPPSPPPPSLTPVVESSSP